MEHMACSSDEAAAVFVDSVRLPKEAVEQFWAQQSKSKRNGDNN